MLGHGFDADRDVVHPAVDRRDAVRVGEAEKRIRHQILRITRGEIAGQRAEQFELIAFGSCAVARPHRRSSAARLAGLFELGPRMALGRQHGHFAGIRSRCLSSVVDPGLQVLDAIDHAAAEFRRSARQTRLSVPTIVPPFAK